MDYLQTVFSSGSIVYPLCMLVFLLVVFRKFSEETRPIFRGIVGGLVVQSQQNAAEWAMVIVLASLGSMQALIDVAHANGWLFVESFAKIATPFLAGLVAGTRSSPYQKSVNVSLPAPAVDTKVTLETTNTNNPTK